MPVVKIGPKHQVTIPKDIFDQLHLEAGDFLEAITYEGKIVMIPKELTAKAPAPPLKKDEQKLLPQVKEKIRKIQIDLTHSQGLNDKETELAVKVNLIDPEQAWWWKEEWQKGEREAEMSITQGEVHGDFKSIDDLEENQKYEYKQ